MGSNGTKLLLVEFWYSSILGPFALCGLANMSPTFSSPGNNALVFLCSGRCRVKTLLLLSALNKAGTGKMLLSIGIRGFS